MDNDWLTRLSHAQSDDERAAIVLQMSLAALPATLQAAAQAAAIPHWFDAQFLDALLGAESDAWYDRLLTLSFVEQTPGRGYAIHERTRRQLLRALWETDPARFRELSGRTADYCAGQLASEDVASQDAAAWQAEAVYHRLVSDPEAGVAELRALATRWANYEFHTYDEIEGTIRLAQEQLAAGRLTGVGAAWTRLWQARLALLYGRPDLAAAPLATIAVDPDDDPYLAAELAQTRGDVLAHSGDRDGMAAAWNAAYDLYQQQAEPQGRLDAYLLAEKMRQHGLPLPAAEIVPDTAPQTPPTGAALRLINNITAAWIEGVLQPAVDQTIDLSLVRDGVQPANLVFHRPLALDRPVAAGQRLSRLFAAAGDSLLILGAPGSGKTITLLQLLDELLKAARADIRAPIPLLFNLSSFAAFSQEKGGTFTDWLAEQAHTQYRLKRETTRERLAAGDRFVLLLDGLDEVRNEAGQREQCIAAINHFMRQTPCGLVVCSRIGDYRALRSRLEVAHALVLQPLGNRQIEAFLQQINSPDRIAMLRRMADDWQLREALRSPLLLNLYPQAFLALIADGKAAGTVEERRQALFAAYVETVFARPAPAGDRPKKVAYGKEQSVGWLRFLAGRMQQVGTALFHVEELQPTWLPPRLIGRYRGLYGLYLGLSVGLIYGLFYGLSGGLIHGLIGGLISGLIHVPIFGLSGGLAGGGVIWLTTRLQKSWLMAGIGGLIFGLIFGLNVGLISGLIYGLIDGLIFGLGVGLISGLGVILSLSIGSLAFDIQLREQVRPLRPNRQRILQYLRRGVRLGLIFGLIYGLVFGLVFGLIGLTGGLIFGLSNGPIGGLIGVSIGGLVGLIMAFWDIPVVDKRPYPNSGSRASIHNALVMTTFAALFFGLPTWFIERAMNAEFKVLVFVLINIPPPTFTWFGGLAWCQHWSLRHVLARRGWLPWRLVPWLEEMAARGLLRRVGGGYIFIHRSLLEYFAALEGE
jgi:eukaryotic-like serine/threonine-protein kinase